MHFYRPLRPVSALTFDLDDTLYDNREVIQRTESHFLQFLQGYHPGLSCLDAEGFRHLRQEVNKQQPAIVHNVTQWRWHAVYLALQRQGLDAKQAHCGADAAMHVFMNWRNRIDIAQTTHDTLQYLAAKFPLVAITNGNASPAACGLGDYFCFVLQAGSDGRSKPFADMYQLAAKRLGIEPGTILHVGDDLNTDVAGALRAGFQACWINSNSINNLLTVRSSRLLPHIEISQLASLTALL